jgi:hypothetical protein
MVTGLCCGGRCAGGEEGGEATEESDTVASCARVRGEGGDGSMRRAGRRRREQFAQSRDAHNEALFVHTVEVAQVCYDS